MSKRKNSKALPTTVELFQGTRSPVALAAIFRTGGGLPVAIVSIAPITSAIRRSALHPPRSIMALNSSIPKFPTPEAASQAHQALRQLERLLPAPDARAVRLEVQGESGGASAIMPRGAFDLLLEILGQMANGNAVTIVPVNAELTTQQAADLLNVSRPYLIGLLEQGKIPFSRVGTHRRIRAEDLLLYRRELASETRASVQELTQQAEDLDLGY